MRKINSKKDLSSIKVKDYVHFYRIYHVDLVGLRTNHVDLACSLRDVISDCEDCIMMEDLIEVNVHFEMDIQIVLVINKEIDYLFVKHLVAEVVTMADVDFIVVEHSLLTGN